MSQRLPTDSYMILLYINILLLAMGSLSIGIFLGHSNQLDWAMMRLDAFKQNRSKILEYIRSDCSQLIVEYPEFYTYPEAELCVTYGFSLKLGKLVVILSILYNTYLLYRLFDLPPLPLIVSGVTLTFLFYITFTNNEWTLQALESILILLGFIMISGHNLFLNIDEHMKKE
ncbi:unnamed protein product [Rotaria sp. Silwood1]|nr:unnamed protein product [Rotaria sp. Silwood1]CAF4079197.1 unnamed protein product [Rotaria sp. Silwood1]CAF5058369.1 unnamed protein product [Rotaria sp. Silwood1]